MNFTENKSNTQDLLSRLVSQSWKDESFKKSLISNPVETIENFLEKPIYLKNGGNQIVVEDQSDKSILYLNIPARPNFDELELTEEQLELVAGGGTPVLYVAAVAVGILIGITGEVL